MKSLKCAARLEVGESGETPGRLLACLSSLWEVTLKSPSCRLGDAGWSFWPQAGLWGDRCGRAESMLTANLGKEQNRVQLPSREGAGREGRVLPGEALSSPGFIFSKACLFSGRSSGSEEDGEVRPPLTSVSWQV